MGSETDMERLLPKITEFGHRRLSSHNTKQSSLTGVQLMRPFSTQLKLVGLWKSRISSEDRASFRGTSTRCILLLTIIYVGLLYKMLVSLSKAIFEGISKVPLAISDVFEIVTGILTTINFLKHQYQIEQLFASNWNIVQPFNPMEAKSITIRTRYLTSLSLTYTSILAIHCVLGITSVLPTQARLQKVFGVDFTEYSWGLVYCIRILVSFAYVTNRLLCSICMVLYVSLCYQMNAKTQQMVRKFKEWTTDNEVKSDIVVHMMLAWGSFASMVRKVDSTYAPIVFLWFGDLLHRLVLYFPVGIQYFSFHNYAAGILYLILAVIYSIIFVLMTVGASGVNDACEELQHVVRSFSYRLKLTDKLVHSNTILFMSSLNCTNVYLTGYNFFVIKRHIVLTVGGMVFTYIVLLDQITQR